MEDREKRVFFETKIRNLKRRCNKFSCSCDELEKVDDEIMEIEKELSKL